MCDVVADERGVGDRWLSEALGNSCGVEVDKGPAAFVCRGRRDDADPCLASSSVHKQSPSVPCVSAGSCCSFRLPLGPPGTSLPGARRSSPGDARGGLEEAPKRTSREGSGCFWGCGSAN